VGGGSSFYLDATGRNATLWPDWTCRFRRRAARSDTDAYGAATLAELGRRGADVVGLDVNAAQNGLVACDVRDQASVDDAVREAITQLGGLDVLINCAGLATPQSAGLPPTSGRSRSST
jgi:NAD(P)-dependent dehydrogenase (short-subunit alcohol dehydrogenase family)